jgi:hypothetical protein
MRFTILSLLFLTAVIGVAFATLLTAVDQAVGATVHGILQLAVVLLAAAAVTVGVLSSERMRVFCLTWGVFFITQNVCHSCPWIVTSWIDNVITVPPASTGLFTDSVTYLHMIGVIWFDVGVATASGCLAVIISANARLDKASPG